MQNVKSHRLNMRVDEADDALFRRAAQSAGESLSSFVLGGARERSERVLADRSRFVLDEQQWAAFNEALDRPPEDLPALRELFARPRPK
ncbi:MAG: DUF1778 domain-containing protein [Solirubrobacteraceae bacterium]